MDTNELSAQGSALNDKLAYVAKNGQPNMLLLMSEYDSAWTSTGASRSTTWNLSQAEDVRYNRWKGQSWDGLRRQDNMGHGETVRPYDKAPDTRIPLADETINYIVDILFAAFFAAQVNPQPVNASKMTAMQTAEWRAIIKWMIKGPLGMDLINQVEFLAQCAHTFGWCVLHPSWQRHHAMQVQNLTMDEVIKFCAAQPEASLMRKVPGMLNDPEAEEGLMEIFLQFFPGINKKTAREIIVQLREKQEADFKLPMLVENGPMLRVLVPGVDIIVPREMTNPQRSRILFFRDFYSTSEIESMVEDEDWSPEFVEAVKATAGVTSDMTGAQESEYDENMRMIEIVTAYVRQVENGVPGVYCTVFSPNMRTAGMIKAAKSSTPMKQGEQGEPAPERDNLVEHDGDLYAKHYLLDFAHGKYPFVFYQTEVTGKRPDDARGVPEMLATPQMEMKKQRDSLFIYSELATTPPLTKIGARASKLPPEFGPLAVFNLTRAGEWEWFPVPPGNPTVAFQLFETIKRERDEYMGLPNAQVHPMRWQGRQKRQVMRWLLAWGQALWQLGILAYQNLSVSELTELLGRQPVLTVDTMLKHHLEMSFEVRGMDPDWLAEMIQQLTALMAMDTGGTIDHSKTVQWILNQLNPTLAEEVSTDSQGAAKRVFNDVRNEVAQMMLGNEGDYVQNDPTAKTKLEYLKQIVQSNPDYILQLHPQSPKFDGRKAELIQKYTKSLQQSAVQQDNKLVGRIGVKPEAMEQKPI